jgi:hypothetical protein
VKAKCPAGCLFIRQIEFFDFAGAEQGNQNVHSMTPKKMDFIFQPVAATRAGHDS